MPIEQFLELRDNTGDLSRRTYNLSVAILIQELDQLRTPEHRREFLLNLIYFPACIEGIVPLSQRLLGLQR